jgi:rhomboid protease GluP
MFGGRKKLVMCQACRGLVEASARTCPLCGRESVPRFRIRAGEKSGGESFFSMLLLAINVVVFVMMAVVDLSSGVEGVSIMNPASPSVLDDFGVRIIPAIQHGEWWRLVTPNFLHLGLMHLMFNSLALYNVGPQVEALYGSQKFILIYLGTGIISNIVDFSFGIQGAGASGALFGLIGLLAVYGHRQGGTFGNALRRQMLIWAAFGIVLGFMFGWDNYAHIGGFIAGAAMAYAITAEEPTIARSALIWNITAIACALVVVASFAMVAKNYGNSQRKAAVGRSYGSVQRLAIVLDSAFNWRGRPEDGDPQALATKLRTAASGVERIPDIDTQLSDICRRLVDQAGRRAALLDAAKTNPEALRESNSNHGELDAAIKDYRAWLESKARELGIE